MAALFGEGLGYKAVARRVGMPVMTAKKWSLAYRVGGREALMAKRGGNRSYDWDTKVAAARDHVDRGVAKSVVMERYAIACVTTLEAWCRAYRAGGAEALRPGRRGRPRGSGPRPEPDPTPEGALREENEFLRARVAYLEKALALPSSRSPTGRKR
mgnify:FL=1